MALNSCQSHWEEGSSDVHNVVEIFKVEPGGEDHLNNAKEKPEISVSTHQTEPEKDPPCDVCSAGFSNKDAVNSHLALHSHKVVSFRCAICHKNYSDKHSLVRHFETHVTAKPFECEVCGKKYTRRSHLNRHLLHHTKENPFKCKFCGKLYPNLKLKTRHENKHDFPIQFQCKVCSKHFSDRERFHEHILLHYENITNFQCIECGKVFKSKKILSLHLYSHIKTEQHKCKVCHKRFAFKYTLARHERAHVRKQDTFLEGESGADESSSSGSDNSVTIECDVDELNNVDEAVESNINDTVDCETEMEVVPASELNLETSRNVITDSVDVNFVEVEIKEEFVSDILRDCDDESDTNVVVSEPPSEISDTHILKIQESTDNSVAMEDNSNVDDYECAKCEERFSDKSMYITHLVQHSMMYYPVQEESSDEEDTSVGAAAAVGIQIHCMTKTYSEKDTSLKPSTAESTSPPVLVHHNQRESTPPDQPDQSSASEQPPVPAKKEAPMPMPVKKEKEAAVGCIYCDLLIETERARRAHYRIHQQQKRIMLQESLNKIKCIRCNGEFEDWIAGMRHCYKEHSSDTNETPQPGSCEDELLDPMQKNSIDESDTTQVPVINSKPVGKRKCYSCDLEFDGKRALFKHFSEHKKLKKQKRGFLKEEVQCPHCTRKFNDKFLYLRHLLAEHRNEKKYHCPECEQVFTVLEDRERHIITHATEDGTHECDQCVKKFRSAKILGMHLNSHTDNVYPCPECGKVFAYKSIMERHRKVHSRKVRRRRPRRPRPSETPVSRFKVEEDNVQVTIVALNNDGDSKVEWLPSNEEARSRYLGGSSTSGTSWNAEETVTTAQSPGQNVEPSGTVLPRLKCTACGKKFLDRASLMRHYRYHHPGSHKEYKCTECDRCFHLLHHLRRHIITHRLEGSAHICDKCGTKFPSAETLSLHEKTHKDSQIPCPECDKTFMFHSHMLRHVSSHAQANRMKLHRGFYKDFSTPVVVTQEGGVNVDPNPHKCPECSEAFPAVDQLLRHRSSHDGDLPCPICFKRFGKAIDLHQHMVSHSSDSHPHKCNTCSRAFPTEESLALHKETHSLRGHTCAVCGKRFRFFSFLKRHAKLHGSENEGGIEEVLPDGGEEDTYMDDPDNPDDVSPLGAENCEFAGETAEHKCKFCGQAFQCKESHDTHLHTHGEVSRVVSKFECQICGRAYNSKYGHYKHMMTHNIKVVSLSERGGFEVNYDGAEELYEPLCEVASDVSEQATDPLG